ncbi:MAG: glycosyltransferase family 2 protein [Akkermansia sp.]|nr:glycosyltransferase family 2 protein [Akkermansia sp.]
MISIVTPTYNSAEYLEECILSLKGQRRRNFEHIIVDGCSTDGTLDIIRKYEGTYPMRWISEKDGGMYEAIAKGFRMAEGDIFAWLNSDDMYLPWATYTMERIMKGGKVQWCTGIPTLYNAEGMPHVPYNHILLYAWPLLKRGWYDGQRLEWIQQESSFWTRKLYEAAGGLDTRFKYAGDYRLWCSFAQHAPLYSTNVVISGFRIHGGQKSAEPGKYRAEQPPFGTRERLLKKYGWYHMQEKWHLHKNAHFIRIQQCPEI